MVDLNLRRLGTVLSSMEYTISKSGKIQTFNYFNSNIESKLLSGKISIESQLMSNNRYYNTILFKERNKEDKISQYEFVSYFIYDNLAEYIDRIEYFLSNNDKPVQLDLNTIIHTYDNTKKEMKSEDSHDVVISNDISNIYITLPKSMRIIENGSKYITRDNDSPDSDDTVYWLLGNTLFSEYKLNDGDSVISLHQISGNYKGNDIELYNFDDDSVQVPTNIKILSHRAQKVYNSNNTDMIYLNYSNNIISESSDNRTRFEEKKDDESSYHTYISLHPNYYDLFDYSNTYSKDKYSVDQYQITDDESYFTRTTYKVENPTNIDEMIRLSNVQDENCIAFECFYNDI